MKKVMMILSTMYLFASLASANSVIRTDYICESEDMTVEIFNNSTAYVTLENGESWILENLNIAFKKDEELYSDKRAAAHLRFKNGLLRKVATFKLIDVAMARTTGGIEYIKFNRTLNFKANCKKD